MRIGLYGGLANNCYVFAKALRHAGQDVIFIRDRNDRYAFSQPVWQDSAFSMGFEDVAISSSFSWKHWKHIEVDQQWLPPTWLVDPLDLQSDQIKICDAAVPYWLKPLANKYVFQGKHRLGVVVTMRTCDVLLVCGIEAAILAMLSGRPYIIWPHGGDIRMAAGIATPPKGMRVRMSYELQRLLLLAAYDRAAYVGTHDAKALGGSVGDVKKALRNTNFVHMPIAISCRARSGKMERHSKLTMLCKALNLPVIESEIICLIPSRVDFIWKGHDLLLGALKRATGREKLHLIFSGWGNDYAHAKTYVAQHRLEAQVTFLPFSLSKPLLAEFFTLVDFAVDQFRCLGTYGTALVEALAAGCPTMMWIDEQAFTARAWEAPPVLNAQSEEDIVSYLEKIACGSIDLEDISQRSQAWIQRVHAPEVVLPQLLHRFEKMQSFELEMA